MAELDIDLTGRRPRRIELEDVEWAEVVVTMGVWRRLPGAPRQALRGLANRRLCGCVPRAGPPDPGRDRTPGRRARKLVHARASTRSPRGLRPLPPLLRVAGKGAHVCDRGVPKSCRCAGSSCRLVDRPRGRDRVELVRVVEDSRLGRPGGARVVVARRRRGAARRAHLDLERVRALLDQPQAEVHVSQQPALVRRPEGRAAAELDACVPTSCSSAARRSEVRPQPRMQLRRLAAERRDADRVLEQAARVAVVRRPSSPAASRSAVRRTSSPDEPSDGRAAARDARPRRRGTRGSRPARPRRVAAPAPGRPDRPPRRARASAPRAGAGHGNARRGRARGPRRPRRSGRPAAPRRSRPAPRCARSGRRARAPGTATLTSSACAPSAPRRTPPQRPGPRRGKRSHS